MLAEPVKINLGAGPERLPGYLSFDYPAEENETWSESSRYNIEELTPDIIGALPDLPFTSNSVDELRIRDVGVYLDKKERKQLGQEITRVLKPGGVLRQIEHYGGKFGPGRGMKHSSTTPREKVDYLFGARYYEDVYHKR